MKNTRFLALTLENQKKLKTYFLCLLLPLLVFNCSDDENIEILEPGRVICNSSELEIISDGTSCDIDLVYPVCQTIEIEETTFIEEEGYSWSPDICSLRINDRIAFKSGSDVTYFDVVDGAHYIAQERYTAPTCREGNSHLTYICQKNEVIDISLKNDLIGREPVHFELRTFTNYNEGETPDPHRTGIRIYQGNGSGIANNFNYGLVLGNEHHPQLTHLYNETITLNGVTYSEVMKYGVDTNGYIRPSAIFYLQKGAGIIGFQKNGTLWTRD